MAGDILSDFRRVEAELLPPIRREAGFEYDPDANEYPDAEAMWRYIEALERTLVATKSAADFIIGLGRVRGT